MATLGNQGSGTGPFSVSGSFGQVAGGAYVVPSPGIIISQLHAVLANNGTSGNGKLYVWGQSGGIPASWMLRSGSFAISGSKTTVNRTDLTVNTAVLDASGFIAGGTNLWIGYVALSGVSQFWGDGSGSSRLGNTNDGNWSDHGATADPDAGTLAAWVDYTLAGVIRVNTGTPAAPNFVSASGVFVQTGTPASPIWTPASDVAVNTGTPASPVWTSAI